MMIKKRLSILLILLANMLILAHAVVPHHHHDKMAVAIINILGQDSHHDEGHHHDSDTEDCLMNEAEAAAALKIQTNDGGFTFSPLQTAHDGWQILFVAVSLYELSFTFYNHEDLVKRRPSVDSGHTDFVARAKGLRAPPSC